MKKLFLLAALFLLSPGLYAQVNLALTAVAKNSGGGTVAPYTPVNYNDNIIVGCTSTCAACSALPWGWVTSGATQWIEYTWTTAQTFDKVVFYKSNRPMSKTTLQYWNGTAYVNIVTYNSTICAADSITFPAVTSTKLRFYGQEGSSNPNYREIQVFMNTPPCKGKPAPGIVAGSVPSGTALCKGSFVNLTVSGASFSILSDIKYQWQRRADGGTAWSAITGATDTLYAADTLIGWDYRLAVICTKTKDTAYTAVYSLPALPNPEISVSPAGPASFCIGDTVWLMASNIPGGVYTWMRNGTPMPGWTFSDFGAVDSGTYTVMVMSGHPCPGYSKPVKLTAKNPGFTVDISTVADSIFCDGEAVTLTAASGKPGVSYQWRRNNVIIPGATAPFYTVTAGGFYRVAASDGVGCPALSRNATFIVHPKPVAEISVPGNVLTACEDKGVRLYATPGFDHQWSRNGLTVVGWMDDSLVVTRSGIYTVKVRSSEGCVNISAPVTITILPSPVPVISKSGLVLSTGTGFDFYVWKRNGSEIVASGAGLSNVNLLKKGLYTVTVTDANGCVGTSAPINVMDAVLGIDNASVTTSGVQVYPNPAHATVFIIAPVKVNVSVKNVTGQLIYTQHEAIEVDISGYADGLYFFTITDAAGTVLKKEKIYKLSQ